MSSIATTTIQTPRGLITLRATTADDASRLRALRLEALADSPTSFGSAVEEIDAHDWTKLVAGDANDAVFVAEHAGQLVGMSGLHRSARQKDRHQALVWGVYVRTAWRRLGVAQVLVNTCCGCAASRGIAIVKLSAVVESGALACYLRCGFRVTGVDPAALKWEGKYYDELLMSRWIKPDAAGSV